jgi:hypothetical protein
MNTRHTRLAACLMSAALLACGAAQAQGLSWPEGVQSHWPLRLVIAQEQPGSSAATAFGTWRSDLAEAMPPSSASAGPGRGEATWSVSLLAARWVEGPMALHQRLPQLTSRASQPQWQPFLGLGWTQHHADRLLTLNADVGLLTPDTTAWGWHGPALLGPNRLDVLVRNLRFNPVLNVGMRLRF